MSVGIFSEDFIDIFYNLHEMGLPVAKIFVLYGAGFSIGKNFVKVMRGSARFGIAVSDFIRDVIAAFIVGYFIGGVGIGVQIFQAMGGDVTGGLSGLVFNFFSAFKISLAALPEFVAAVSSVLAGAIIGVFFGFLFT